MTTNTIKIPVNELTQFDLPKVCVMTGATEGVEFRPVKFQWYPPWLGILIVVNVLVAAIVISVMTKKAKGELPMTHEAWAKWKKWKMLTVFSVLGFIGGVVLSLVLLMTEVAALGGVLFFATLIQLIVCLVVTRKAGPQVKEIKDNVVTLQLPMADVAATFTAHLTGGARRASSLPANV